MLNLQHTDGDTRITLVEAPRGIYTVQINDGDQPIIELNRTIIRDDALRSYNQAVADENDQYMV